MTDSLIIHLVAGRSAIMPGRRFGAEIGDEEVIFTLSIRGIEIARVGIDRSELRTRDDATAILDFLEDIEHEGSHVADR